LTVIVVVDVAVHPPVLVTVTVYVVVVDGATLMDDDVLPLLQRYEPPPVAVSVALAPVQMMPSLLVAPDVSDTSIDADGRGLTVIVVVAVAVQLFEFVTVTV
jgi:hypothetical protein